MATTTVHGMAKLVRCLGFSVLVAASAMAQTDDPNSPRVGDAAQGRAILQAEGPTPADVQREMSQLSPSEAERQHRQEQCDWIRAKIQMQLDLEAAGSMGYYSMPYLRALERQDCPSSLNLPPTKQMGSFIVSLGSYPSATGAVLLQRLLTAHLPAHSESSAVSTAIKLGPYKARGDADDGRDRARRAAVGQPLVVEHAPLVNMHDMDCTTLGSGCTDAEYAKSAAATERRWRIAPIKIQQACAQNNTIMTLTACMMKQTVASRDVYSSMPWLPGVDDPL